MFCECKFTNTHNALSVWDKQATPSPPPESRATQNLPMMPVYIRGLQGKDAVKRSGCVNPAGITIETKNIRSSNDSLYFLFILKQLGGFQTPSKNTSKIFIEILGRFYTAPPQFYSNSFWLHISHWVIIVSSAASWPSGGYLYFLSRRFTIRRILPTPKWSALATK